MNLLLLEEKTLTDMGQVCPFLWMVYLKKIIKSQANTNSNRTYQIGCPEIKILANIAIMPAPTQTATGQEAIMKFLADFTLFKYH